MRKIRRARVIASQAMLLFIGLTMVTSFENCSKVAFNSVPPTVASEESVSGAPTVLNPATTSTTTSSSTGSSVATPATTDGSAPAVCNPFGGGATSTTQGLVGSLHYLSTAQLQGNLSSYNNFSDVYNGASGIYSGNVYMSSVNVPTRYFEEGFADSTGQDLQQADGTPLVEFFSLQLHSNLVLGQLTPGDYQIAVLSDDGSILTLSSAIANADGTYSDLIINNDGDHPNELGCGQQKIHFDATTRIPLTLDYYQGPPNSIAMMILIRPVPKDGSLDSQCGVSENDTYYFDINHDSKVNAGYQALLNRGWTPVSSANYVLPDTVANPCN